MAWHERVEEAESNLRAIVAGGALASVETVRTRRDGTRIHVRISSAGVRNGHGETTGIILLVDDITERVRAERLRDLERTVTRILAEAQSVHEAMGQVLPAVCEATGCAYGGRWLIDAEDGRVRCSETWAEEAPALRDFVNVTAVSRRRPGESGGLIRRMWIVREPVWVEDIAQIEGFDRRDAALAAGLKCAFAFPVLVAGEFYGAMEFFARFSHRVIARTKKNKSVELVEAVDRVISVDLVCDPSTTSSIFESEGERMDLKKLKTDHPALVSELLEEFKSSLESVDLQEQVEKLGIENDKLKAQLEAIEAEKAFANRCSELKALAKSKGVELKEEQIQRYAKSEKELAESLINDLAEIKGNSKPGEKPSSTAGTTGKPAI